MVYTASGRAVTSVQQIDSLHDVSPWKLIVDQLVRKSLFFLTIQVGLLPFPQYLAAGLSPVKCIPHLVYEKHFNIILHICLDIPYNIFSPVFRTEVLLVNCISTPHFVPILCYWSWRSRIAKLLIMPISTHRQPEMSVAKSNLASLKSSHWTTHLGSGCNCRCHYFGWFLGLFQNNEPTAQVYVKLDGNVRISLKPVAEFNVT
jgi:hypothetical protein